MSPDDLATEVQEAIEKRLDHDIYRAVLSDEERDREELVSRVVMLMNGD